MKKTNTTKALEAKVTTLEERIAELEKQLKSVKSTTRTTKTAKAEPKTKTKAKSEPKNTKAKAITTVGNLIFCDRWVKTGEIKNKSVRHAIFNTITKDFGGIKLTKGNATYEKCYAEDKYVQVYEFKTVEDCNKFMQSQLARVGK